MNFWNNASSTLIVLLIMSCSSSNGGVLGEDLNKDGIRDDVEVFIENSKLSPEQIQSSRYLAKALQETIKQSWLESGDALSINKALLDAHGCNISRFDKFSDGVRWSENIYAKILNSRSRKKAMQEHVNRLGPFEYIALNSKEECKFMY